MVISTVGIEIIRSIPTIMSPRAISNKQKLERQQAILETAWAMFQETDYPAVTIAGVAERLGLAKGTIYLYFPRKEELFLVITMGQLARWFEEMDTNLDRIEGISPAQLAEMITQSLAARPDLIRLLAILSTVLEQNVSYEAAYAFKQRLGMHLARTGGLLEDRVAAPNGETMLLRGAGARFLLRLHALIVGLHHLSNPGSIVRQVLAAPEMQGYTVDFNAELFAMIPALLI